MHFAVPFQVCCMAHCRPARRWKPLTSAVPAMRNESTDVSARVLATVHRENMCLFTAFQLRLKQKVRKYFKKGAHFLSAYDPTCCLEQEKIAKAFIF